jgi:hypothetical protein
MARILLVFLITFLSAGVSGQDKTRYYPTNFTIEKSTGIRPPACDCPEFILDEMRAYGPPKISESKNDIEIRLFIPGSAEHGTITTLNIMKYKGGKWDAAIYKKAGYKGSINFKTDFPQGIYKDQYTKYRIQKNIDSAFTVLKNANVFKVSPSPIANKDLWPGPIVFEYKINNQVGSYKFNCIFPHLAKHPADKEELLLLKIINLMN